MNTSDKFFARIIEQSKEIIFMFDFETLDLLYANESTSRFLGYSNTALLRMNLLDICCENEKPEFRKTLNSQQRDSTLSEEHSIETSFLKKNGSDFPVEMRYQRDTINGLEICIVFVIDISERIAKIEELQRSHEKLKAQEAGKNKELLIEIKQCKAFEENLKLSEERFYDIASASSDGFWETNSKLEFIFIDASFLKIVDIDPDHFLGLKNLDSSRYFEYGVESHQHLEKIQQHLPFRNLQLKYKASNGSIKHISLSGTPAFDQHGKFKGYRGAGSDITLHIEAEQLTTKARKELLITKEEAERANKVKTEFLASMSHEFRTPLNCILGFAQLLELNNDGFNDSQNTHIRHILSSGEQLLDLVDDVLEFNTIEHGHISISHDNIVADEVIAECLQKIQHKADEKNITFLKHGHTEKMQHHWLWTDSTRLKQLLLNFLSNAVKYSDSGSKVTIYTDLALDNMLRISVADSGPGIPLDRHKDLFNPFERLGRETGPIEGTGIGLSICKRLTELLDGRIGFDSMPGKGSTFWIELPLSQKKNLAEAESILEVDTNLDKSNPAGLTNTVKVLLYVEDDPNNQSLMGHILDRLPKTEGVSAVKMLTAHNAELGIDLAKSQHPDVILMDINLPGMNGIDAVQELKRIKETQKIPVIAISGDASPQAINEGLNLGFEAYLTKPIKVKDVQHSISKILNNQTERQLS